MKRYFHKEPTAAERMPSFALCSQVLKNAKKYKLGLHFSVLSKEGLIHLHLSSECMTAFILPNIVTQLKCFIAFIPDTVCLIIHKKYF